MAPDDNGAAQLNPQILSRTMAAFLVLWDSIPVAQAADEDGLNVAFQGYASAPLSMLFSLILGVVIAKIISYFTSRQGGEASRSAPMPEVRFTSQPSESGRQYKARVVLSGHDSSAVDAAIMEDLNTPPLATATSRRQETISRSTPEIEIVSAAYGLQMNTPPMTSDDRPSQQPAPGTDEASRSMGNRGSPDADIEITSRLGTHPRGTVSMVITTGKIPDESRTTHRSIGTNCHLLPTDYLHVDGLIAIAKRWWTYAGKSFKRQRGEYITIHKEEAEVRNTLYPLPCADIETWD